MTLDQHNLENGNYFPPTDKNQLRPSQDLGLLSGNFKKVSNGATKPIDTGIHSSVSHTSIRPTRPTLNCGLGQMKNLLNSYSNTNGNSRPTKNDLGPGGRSREVEGQDSDTLDDAEVGLCSSDDSEKDVDEEYSDSDPNYDSDCGMIISTYSLAKNEENSNISSSLGARPSPFMEITEPNVQSCEKINNAALPKLDKLGSSGLQYIQDISKPISNKISKRSIVRNDLHSAAKKTQLITSPQLRPNPIRQQSPFTKRILEVSSSNSSDGSETRSRPKRKLKRKSSAGPAENRSWPNLKPEVDLYSGAKLKNDIQLGLGLNPEATSAAILLSQSLGEPPVNQSWEDLSQFSVKTLSVGLEANQEKSKLTAYLNEDGGFFQIGAETSGDSNYVFSVTINYAKSLSDVIPREVASSRDKDFQFCYSLFDCSITTDVFCDLDCPEISSEKASAKVHSTAENLSEYFNQHSILPIYLVTGKRKLAFCEINLKSLVEVIHMKDIKLEGIFDIYEIGKVFSQSSNSFSKHDAKLAVSIQIENEDSKLFIPNQLVCGKKNYKQRLMKKNIFWGPSDDSTDSSLSSDCKQKLKSNRPNVYTKRKYKVKNTRNASNCCHQSLKRDDELNCLKHTDIKKYKARLMNDAENEVKLWKKELKNICKAKKTMHEQSLQKYIATECLSRINEVETELNKRLEECDKLQETLTTALNNLTYKEELLHARELEIAKSEKELNDRLQSFMKIDENSKSIDLDNRPSRIPGQDKKLAELQNQNCQLQLDLIKAGTDNKELTLENIKLKRQLVESENLIRVTLEKEALVAKSEKLIERKKYYKEQWLIALSDLHKLHSTNSESLNNFLSTGTPFYSLNNEQSTSKLMLKNSNEFHHTGQSAIKLLKLKEERKELLNTGHVSPDHFIIRNIDRKIKALVMGTSQS